ncbi:MAG: hypothetical protein H0T42_30380 [Deltaproteobacteria bacterium]|nr:hypothetical protein [Deltaproteobacteria bacterium]
MASAEDESPPLSIYGFARLDVLADDSRMSDIHQPLFVMREPGGGAFDGELTMTPRLSRVGLGIDEWDLDDNDELKGEGKLEIDFGGAGGVNLIRLRHAYAQIGVKNKVELLAGQTWDLVSPLFPSAQNDTQLLFAGNTGDRRPQLRLSMYPSDKVRIAVAAAATGSLDQRDLDADGQLDGMASARPMIQGLIELRTRMLGDAAMRFGVWGHIARDELADGTRHPSRSIGAHLFFPAGPKMVWIAEIYGGSNVADIGGGIGQSVNAVTGRTIRAVGGWAELAIVPTQKHMVAFGASGDFAYADDIEMGDREKNGTTYGVIRYKPKASLQLGVEYLYWKTLYKGMSSGTANRFNLHLSVFF